MDRSRQPRVDDFLKAIRKPAVRVPDSKDDFYMYERMKVALDGLSEHFDRLRSNQGRLGYSAQNLMSDITKASIEAAILGDEVEQGFLDDDMDRLAEGINDASYEIAESGNRFAKTLWQEKNEAKLFGQIWKVIIGESDKIPELTPWNKFKGNLQAYLYGYLDVVTELAKAIGEKMSEPMTTEQEFQIFRRYLAIADSIALHLSFYRHVPGYVINNGFGRWMAYTTKLRTVYGCIAHVRRDYNLRLSNRRMITEMESRIMATLRSVARNLE